jgi:phosphoinositide-3-kinase, regulatory subunit 4
MFMFISLKDGAALILVPANVRNCSLPSSKVRALDVFLALSCHLTDEAKLDRMVPYIVECLNDDTALVRSAALRSSMQVVSLDSFTLGSIFMILIDFSSCQNTSF